MDFTFVCPTEIAELGKRNEDFRDRDAQVLGMSTDTHFVHLAWRRDHADLKSLPFPMRADTKRELSTSLGTRREAGGAADEPADAARHQSDRLRADGAGGERHQWLRDVRARAREHGDGGRAHPDHVNDAGRIAATVCAAATALEAGETGAAEAPPMEVSARGA
jgi:hypothetical protein